MAFQFGIEPLDVPVEDDTGSFTIDFPLGYDLDRDTEIQPF